jgi:cold-inducible RNA-binding protein
VNSSNSKLFVGNLSFQTTRDELMQYFSGAGTVVDAVILTNKFSGRSRGFGFVQMSTDAEAIHAKEMFHGKEFMGRVLVVNDATPERPKDIYQAPESPAPVAETPAAEMPAPVIDMPVAVEPTAVEPMPSVETVVEPVVEPMAQATDVVPVSEEAVKPAE